MVSALFDGGLTAIYSVAVVLLVAGTAFLRKNTAIDTRALNLAISLVLLAASGVLFSFTAKLILAIFIGVIGVWVGIDAVAALRSGRSIGHSDRSVGDGKLATERISDMDRIGKVLKENPMTAREIAAETNLSLAEVQQGLQTLSEAQTISYHSTSTDGGVIWKVEESNTGLDSFVGSVIGGTASRLVRPFDELLTGNASS